MLNYTPVEIWEGDCSVTTASLRAVTKEPTSHMSLNAVMRPVKLKPLKEVLSRLIMQLRTAHGPGDYDHEGPARTALLLGRLCDSSVGPYNNFSIPDFDLVEYLPLSISSPSCTQSSGIFPEHPRCHSSKWSTINRGTSVARSSTISACNTDISRFIFMKNSLAYYIQNANALSWLQVFIPLCATIKLAAEFYSANYLSSLAVNQASLKY
ncbi:hypothetical protein B0H11DRAFT_1939763 [Mycena galericulata]|nr:hypothetical protein B0H11DRAFT_1939763 [Mycena galericulata]